MAIETQSKTIEGYEVRCTPMGALAAGSMLTRLMKFAGPTMMELRKVNWDVIGVNRMLTFAEFVPTVSALMGALGPEDFTQLACQLLKSCTVIRPEGCEPRKVDLIDAKKIDVAFEGQLGLMLYAIAYVLEVNFANFFRGLVFGDTGAEQQPAAE